MKILVAVKQVALLEDEVEFVDDGAAVDPDFLEWSLNEWDAFANEAARTMATWVAGIWERVRNAAAMESGLAL